MTLRDLIAAYEASEGRRATHKSLPAGWPEYRRTVEHVFAPLLGEPLEQISENRLQAVLDVHPSRGSAARAWAYLRPVIKSARKLTAGAWRLVDIEDVHAHHQTQVLDRVLSESELRRLLPVLRELLSDPHAAALHMLLLTGCRAEELLGSDRHPGRGMQRQHVEPDGAWTIPATKNGKGFVVPLPARARKIVAHQIESHSHPRVFCDPRGAGKHLGSWQRHIERIAKAASIETRFTRHDLRRTMATGMQTLGIADPVVDACLGHAHRGAARHYLHGRAFWTDRADAHRKWAAFIEDLR